MPEPVSRRRFLAATGAALGLGPAFAACGGGGDVASADCRGYDALTEADLQNRAALNYVDSTPVAGQRCDNCRLVVNDGWEDSPCVGCQLFAGPVAPGGYCTGWQAQAA